MNYSTLLRRSVDSDEYFKIPGIGLYANYPSELERPLLLSLIQLLWDRGEANGYAHNMTTDPLPNTPPHEVLLQAALGDHQVANVTAEVEARTIGASVYSPALEPGRHWEAIRSWASPQVTTLPRTPAAACSSTTTAARSGSPATRRQGTATPPNENVPPRPEWGYGGDPHGYPRGGRRRPRCSGELPARRRDPAVRDPDGYCFSNGYTGP